MVSWRSIRMLIVGLLCAWWFFHSSILLVTYAPPILSQQFIGSQAYSELGTHRVSSQHSNLIQFLTNTEPLATHWYTPKEYRHMHDVRNLLQTGTALWFALLIVSIYYRKKIAKNLVPILTTSLTSMLLLGLIIVLVFEPVFYALHLALFRNTDWLLNPEIEKLIVLYDQQFFIYFSVTVVTIAALLQVALLWGSKKKIRT